VVETFTQIRATACDERNFGRALQLRIRNHADDDEVLGERKRKGPRNAIGTQICFGSCVAPRGRLRPAFWERQPRPSARLSDPCAPSRPIRKKWVSGLRTGRGHMVRLLALAGASSRRGETRGGSHHHGREDGPLSGRERALYAVAEVMQAVRGSRCRPALSVGRRRDLAFGSFAPPSHRKGRRAKGSKGKLEGENVRGYGSQARLTRALKARS